MVTKTRSPQTREALGQLSPAERDSLPARTGPVAPHTSERWRPRCEALRGGDERGLSSLNHRACARRPGRWRARSAASDATVLITGENGVGKGSWPIGCTGSHPCRSAAADGRPRTLSGGLVESELFGHERRLHRRQDAAYRSLRAGRRGHAVPRRDRQRPLEQQSRLLRVIETGEFERVGSSRTRRTDARLLCRDQRRPARGGRRRALSPRPVLPHQHGGDAIPPLRDRREDILPLAAALSGASPLEVPPGRGGLRRRRDECATSHPWPGNVRELAHAVERAVLFAAGPRVTADVLDLRPLEAGPHGSTLDGLTLEQAEKQLIQRALQRQRRQRARGGRRARPEPQRALPSAGAPRHRDE